ncbi:MAG: GntR family transcriptional regulator [Dehalobacterium sp.]
MSDKILKMPSLQEQVYLYIKSAIVKGELQIGELYSEQWCSDLLGVSRTPVREAVLKLKQDNLLEIIPYRGFTVKTLSPEDVKETFEIRQALEGFCVIRIAQKYRDPGAQDVLARLEGYLREQSNFKNEKNIYEFMELDELYHRDIISFSRNERLADTFHSIHNRFQRITVKVLKEPGRIGSTIKEHATILAEMKRGDPWASYRLMSEHLNETRRIVEAL